MQGVYKYIFMLLSCLKYSRSFMCHWFGHQISSPYQFICQDKISDLYDIILNIVQCMVMKQIIDIDGDIRTGALLCIGEHLTELPLFLQIQFSQTIHTCKLQSNSSELYQNETKIYKNLIQIRTVSNLIQSQFKTNPNLITQTIMTTVASNIIKKNTVNSEIIPSQNEDNIRNTFQKWGCTISGMNWKVGVATHLTLSATIFGLTYLIVKKTGGAQKILNLLRLQNKIPAWGGNLLISGVIYKALFPARVMLTFVTVPFVAKALDIKLDEKQYKENEPKLEFPFGNREKWGQWCGWGQQKSKNNQLLSQAGITPTIKPEDSKK